MQDCLQQPGEDLVLVYRLRFCHLGLLDAETTGVLGNTMGSVEGGGGYHASLDHH